jgi:hypothetical protein
LSRPIAQVLFTFGYRREFRNKLQERIDANIAEYRATLKNGSKKSS